MSLLAEQNKIQIVLRHTCKWKIPLLSLKHVAYLKTILIHGLPIDLI